MTVSSRHRHPQPDPPHGVHGDREAPGRPQFIENGRESPGCAGSSAAAAPAPQQSSGATMFPPYPYRAKEFAFIHAGGLFHLFYMRHDLSALDDDSSDVDVGHAVSQNLTDWTQLDPVLHVGPDNWDNW